MWVEFSETLFDVNSVRVVFSSTCTDSVTVDYSNPLLITIPDTGANTEQCQYNIQLVDRATSTLTIGYPITGFFNTEGEAKYYTNFQVNQYIMLMYMLQGSLLLLQNLVR